MPEFSFNPKPLGVTVDDQDADMRYAVPSCAFQPVMVFKPGIEAIMEGLRLANIESVPVDAVSALAGNIDP